MDILDVNVCYEEASVNSFISGYSEQRFVAMQSLLLSNVFSIYFSLIFFGCFLVFFICFFGYCFPSIKESIYALISINSLSICLRSASCFLAHSFGSVGSEPIHSSNPIVR